MGAMEGSEGPPVPNAAPPDLPRCGYVPPTLGYGPCARTWGHTGPCAHGYAPNELPDHDGTRPVTAKQALGTLLATQPRCESLHHAPKDRHALGEPCPVEARVREAERVVEALFTRLYG